MNTLIFDGTWDGMLSAVFEAYTRRWHIWNDENDIVLLRPDAPRPLFADNVAYVTTDSERSNRVWKALEQKMERAALSALAVSFLSEDITMDTPTLRFIIKVIEARQSGFERNFADNDALAIVRTAKQVRYDAHRLLQFIRFQKAADGTYFAMTDPRHNVLPMILDHFTDRFADQHFIIYDHRRGYGYFYDGTEPRLISLPANLNHMATGWLPDEMLAPDERLFRRLWQTYFKAIAIKERTNPRKQRADMPVRYWRYLTEKN
ncbi:MAG: TIGR03915 family putative DNA repair protein [Muribaculaceae bacterium]|nr:TIGR03915 family putative DNA repair protein [Muribaculaceae bacterium]